MPLSLLQQQDSLLRLINREETVFRVYKGIEANRIELLNRDGSHPRVRRSKPSQQEIGFGNLSASTEYHRVTWVHDLANGDPLRPSPPPANETWWISDRSGNNITQVKWCERWLRNQGVFWWIYLKKDFNEG